MKTRTGMMRNAAGIASLLSLFNNGCESTSITKCKETQEAYCNYVTRCSGTGAAEAYRAACLLSVAAAMDCGAASELAAGTDACLGSLGTASCDSPPAECGTVLPPVMLPPPPCRLDPGAPPSAQAALLEKCVQGVVSRATFDAAVVPDVDFLFVVDNSQSMTPKQRVLGANIPQFFQAIDSLNVNYHIGIATTDIGYQASPGTMFPGFSIVSCDSYTGDDGSLQILPCTARTGVTQETTIACSGGMINGMVVPALCPDASYVPGGGKSYIDVNKTLGTSNVKTLMMGGKDVGPLRTFQCIGLVGDAGCGLESPLESAKRALDGHRSDNVGFLRANSVLVVVFLTDEEDCSIQLARRSENNPATVTQFMSGGMTYACDTPLASSNVNQSGVEVSPSCYGLDYRCLANNVICDQPMNTVGAKTNCRPRASGAVEPIDKYVKFFSTLRTPDKLVLAGIWAPSMLDSTSAAGQLIVRAEPNGASGVAGYNRGYRAEAACHDPSVPIANPNDVVRGFIGGAQLRLSSFIRRFQNRREVSICDTANYAQAMTGVASLVSQVTLASCLDKPPVVENGIPQCLVGYVDAARPGSPPEAALPVCSSSCCAAWAATPQPKPSTPAVNSACTAEAADCYCALPSTRPDVCTGGAVVGVWRKDGAAAPSGKIASVSCVNQ